MDSTNTTTETPTQVSEQTLTEAKESRKLAMAFVRKVVKLEESEREGARQNVQNLWTLSQTISLEGLKYNATVDGKVETKLVQDLQAYVTGYLQAPDGVYQKVAALARIGKALQGGDETALLAYQAGMSAKDASQIVAESAMGKAMNAAVAAVVVKRTESGELTPESAQAIKQAAVKAQEGARNAKRNAAKSDLDYATDITKAIRVAVANGKSLVEILKLVNTEIGDPKDQTGLHLVTMATAITKGIVQTSTGKAEPELKAVVNQ